MNERYNVKEVTDSPLRYWSKMTAYSDFIIEEDKYGQYDCIYNERGLIILRHRETGEYLVLEFTHYDVGPQRGANLASKEKIMSVIDDLKTDIKVQKSRVENYDFTWEWKPIEKVREESERNIKYLNYILSILEKVIKNLELKECGKSE